MSLRVRQSPPPPQAALGCSLFRLTVQNFRHRNVLSGPSIICGLLGRERWECASCCALSSSLHSLSFAPDPRRRRLTHLLPLMCNCPVRATPSPDLLIRRRRLAPQRTAMTLPFSLSSSFRSEWISLSSPSCLARTPVHHHCPRQATTSPPPINRPSPFGPQPRRGTALERHGRCPPRRHARAFCLVWCPRCAKRPWVFAGGRRRHLVGQGIASLGSSLEGAGWRRAPS
jgi:hypothetical protein